MRLCQPIKQPNICNTAVQHVSNKVEQAQLKFLTQGDKWIHVQGALLRYKHSSILDQLDWTLPGVNYHDGTCILCPLNLGTFTNKLTTHSNCSLHEPSLVEHELREPPRKKLNSHYSKNERSIILTLYHYKAIASFPGSRLGPGNEVSEL